MSSSRVIGALCVLCAFTLTYKYFPGVENSHYYGGFVMKSLYPELMFHDPILGTEAGEIAPYAMTIYYALPKLFGELWLDDRFVLPFYFLLVLGSCVLIDRIAVMIGCTETFGRALILLLFLRDHKLLENEVNLAHQPDFHHSAFAVPLSLLVFWMCIARKPLWMLLGSIGLLAATTAQVVPLVGGSALLAYTVYADTRSGRLWGSGLVLAGILASVYVFVFYLAPPAGTELSLWEILKWEWYEGMVAPFELSFGSTDQILFGLIVVTAVCSVAIFWPVRGGTPLSIARCIVAVSAIVFAALAIYGHWAPDAAKWPQLLMFPVTRQFQGAQVLAYVVAGFVVLEWVRLSPTHARTSIAVALIGLFLIAGPGNNLQWVLLFCGAAAAAICLNIGIKRTWKSYPASFLGKCGAENPALQILVISSMIVFAIVYAASGVRQANAWVYLAREGIHGSSTVAEWTDVSRWVRSNLPKDAIVVPFQYRYTTGSIFDRPRSDSRDDDLVVTRSLMSRTGKIVPKPMLLSRGLDIGHFMHTRAELDHLTDIGTRWQKGDASGVSRGLNALAQQADYLIFPIREADKLEPERIGFQPLMKIGHYQILVRKDG